MQCYFCHKDLQTSDRIGRQDSCPHCGRDVHICRNCDFYDPSAYNECREPQAERVVDKEKSNFCDYFVVRRGGVSPPKIGGRGDRAPTDPVIDAKNKLEQLFKK